MKIKSLILSSVAAVGFSTGAMAADLGTVLTSLDVCDALGISGLTISSDTNCLAITGGVEYEFKWGDYNGAWNGNVPGVFTNPDNDIFSAATAATIAALAAARALPRGTAAEITVSDAAITAAEAAVAASETAAVAAFNAALTAANAAVTAADAALATAIAMPNSTVAEVTARNAAILAANAGVTAADALVTAANAMPGARHGDNQDWDSNVDAWLKFVGTADSSFGPASATIKLGYDNDADVNNEGAAVVAPAAGAMLVVDEAYVSVGDTTILMAGLKGSIANMGDDVSLTWLKLFNDEVGFVAAGLGGGGTVIQVTSDLGNGVSVGGALERLNAGGLTGGTAVGVFAYAGSGITAHATVVADGVLTGTVANWGIHAGITGEFDPVTFGAAFSAESDVAAATSAWDAQATASATFDMFTLAVAGQAGSSMAAINNVGVAISASAEVTTGVTINAGFRWHDTDTAILLANTEGWQAAAGVTAAVTETITLTGEIGVYGNPTGNQTNAYGSGTVAWEPGGGFTSSLNGVAWQNGAYALTFKAAKSFE